MAAIWFRAALVAFLSQRHTIEINSLEELQERRKEIGLDMTYDEALAEMFGHSLR